MVENPYKAPAQDEAHTASGDEWLRRLRRWSHGQPLALFDLVLMVVSILAVMLGALLP